MSLELDIYLNQLAQGVKPLPAAEQWFLQLPEQAQVDALRRLASHAMQAGAVGGNVDAAVSASGLKSSYTPCSMLAAHTKDQKASSALRVAVSRVIALPAPERRKIFLLLIALLCVADRRRREHLSIVEATGGDRIDAYRGMIRIQEWAGSHEDTGRTSGHGIVRARARFFRKRCWSCQRAVDECGACGQFRV